MRAAPVDRAAPVGFVGEADHARGGRRAAEGTTLDPAFLNAANLERVRRLDAIAKRRGQTLARMALAWVLRGKRATSALIGASRPERAVEGAAALENAAFSAEELAEIDRYAVESGVDVWARSSETAAGAALRGSPR
jgi:L-glyceraldehyde 3-phosphate reductase